MCNLNLQELVLKEKLFEIIKELKYFKFQQNLKTQFKKDKKFLEKKIFVDPWLDKQHNDLSVRIENWTREDSGWSFHLIFPYFVDILIFSIT